MLAPMVIRTKSGMVFKMHPVLGLSLADFRFNKETRKIEMVPFPSDLADTDPVRAEKLARELGYTQDETGAWCDPMLGLQ